MFVKKNGVLIAALMGLVLNQPVFAEALTVGEMVDLSKENAGLDLQVSVQEKRNKLKALQNEKPGNTAPSSSPSIMPPLPGPGQLPTLPSTSLTDDDLKIVNVSGFDNEIFADVSYNGVVTTVSSKNKSNVVFGGWKIEQIDRTRVDFSKAEGKKVVKKTVYLSSPPPTRTVTMNPMQSNGQQNPVLGLPPL